MSSRNIRKYVGGNKLPPPDSDDEDFEPPSTSSKKQPFNPFYGLKQSSESEPDSLVKSESDEEIQINKKPRKRNNRKKRNKASHFVASKIKMDEVDKCLREINAKYGPPPEPKPEIIIEKSIDDILLGVDIKFLNPPNELEKLLGPDLEERAKRRTRERTYIGQRKGLVLSMSERFRRNGLSMSMMTTHNADRCHYFTIDHDRSYRRKHKEYLTYLEESQDELPILNIRDTIEILHVEKCLQIADMLFVIEEYRRGKKLIERIVAYLQYISHPAFRMNNRRVRLEYRVLENRVYLVSIVKYIYVLTNSACHRTALELSKVVLNLDPTDPLAMILLMDMLALRARQYQWVIDIVPYWESVRDGKFLLNLQYSRALSKFHYIREKSGPTDEADNALKLAMKHFPSVVPAIYKVTNHKDQRIDDCEMFKDKNDLEVSKQHLWNDVLNFYTHFTAFNWQLNEVWAWFSKNAVEMAKEYNDNLETQKYVNYNTRLHRITFLRDPHVALMRHFQVIKHMNNFIFDEVLFPTDPCFTSYNPEPWPAEVINRYKYQFVPLLKIDGRTFRLFGEVIQTTTVQPGMITVQQIEQQHEQQQQDEAAGGSELNLENVNTINLCEFFGALCHEVQQQRGPTVDPNVIPPAGDARWDVVVPEHN
ncbi:ribosome quality control complex subunit TCF25-like [Plodia interpunctella]|uniref:ribosome quality control complex subunit TCF25-like n=1 Tax=Plodia interpunctella TaxID=58824 RepID=UPI002367D502|nr:transcription factor 25-like [Plodia interpunctella]XP_053623812.1 transcription factor 25-like [Plodia interpunctella]